MEHNKFTVGTPVTYNCLPHESAGEVVYGHVTGSDKQTITILCRHTGTTYIAHYAYVSVDFTRINEMKTADVLYFIKNGSLSSEDLRAIREKVITAEWDVNCATKTDTAKEVTHRHGLPVTEVKLSCTEPEDLAGLPINSVPHQPRDYSKLMNPKQHNKPLELTSHEYTRVWVKRTGDDVVTHMTAVGDVTEVTREIMGDDGETYTVSIKVEVKKK